MFAGQKLIISDYHKYMLWYFQFSWNHYIYRITMMSMAKVFWNSLRKYPKKRDLSNQSKTCQGSKKFREDKSTTGSCPDMADVSAESLKSPDCMEIAFNCLRIVERQTGDI